jgi:hypothetical protein
MEQAVVLKTTTIEDVISKDFMGSMFSNPSEPDETEASLIERRNEFLRIGMKGKSELLTEQLAGHRLRKLGLLLFETEREGDGAVSVHTIDSGGKCDVGYFKKERLSKSNANVPLEFLKNIPDDIASKLFIFTAYQRRDPIIAVKCKGFLSRTYIGMFRW